MNRTLFSLLLAIGTFVGFVTESHGWKIPTHVGTANRALDEFSSTSAITEDDAANTVRFLDPKTSRQLSIPVTVKDAYLAVKHNPSYFRAGVIGPDMFADFASGQTFQHGNETPAMWKAIDFLKRQTSIPAEFRIPGTYVVPDKSPTLTPLESRTSPSQFRSIDYAMAMVQYYESNYLGKVSKAEGEKIIAFIIGYVGHCIGDAFAHTWINGKVGGAWDYTKGSGTFGVLSEEIKHVTLEGYVDHKMPEALLQSSESHEIDRAEVAAPVEFLDSFFSRRLPVPASNNMGKVDGTYQQFFNYFANIDQFQGGPTYNFFNFQYEFANGAFLRWANGDKIFELYNSNKQTVKDWGWFLEYAQDDRPSEMLEKLLMAGGIHGIQGQISLAINQFGWDNQTCKDADVQLNDLLIDLYDEIGGIEKRMLDAREFADVAKKNWVLMSQCTAENMAKLNGGEYDKDDPGMNTDACMDMVRAKWRDETPEDPNSLFRGSMRAPYTPQQQKFLDKLVFSFRGYTDEEAEAPGFIPFEEANDHRKASANVARAYRYMVTAGFTVNEYLQAILPSDPTFDKACAASRKRGTERHCLQEQWDNLLSWYYLGQCWDGVKASVNKCWGDYNNNWENCVTDPYRCPQATAIKAKMESTIATMKGWANSNHLSLEAQMRVAQSIAESRAKFEKEMLSTCVGNSAVISYCGTKEAAVDAQCTVEEIGRRLGCTVARFDDEYTNDPSFEAIMSKVEEVCDWRDATSGVMTAYKDLDTEVERRKFLLAQGLPIAAYQDGVRSLEDMLAKKPDYYPVNLIFLKDDLTRSVAQSTSYANDVAAAVAAKRLEIQNNWPAGPSKTDALAAIGELQAFIAEVRQHDIKYYFPYDKVDLEASLAYVRNSATKAKLEEAQEKLEDVKADVDDGISPAEADALIDAVRNLRTDLENLDLAAADWTSPEGKDQRDKLLLAVNEMTEWLVAVKEDLQGLPDVNFNNFRLFKEGFEDLEAGAEKNKLVNKLVGLDVFPAIKGPTVLLMDQEMGLKQGDDRFTVEDFTPFYNTVQGLKLAPLTSKTDIQNLFVSKSLGTSNLPWNGNAALYSAVCKDPNNKNLVNVYCDVLTSNDDPSCHGCQTKPAKDPSQSMGDYLDGNLEPFTNPLNGSVLTLRKSIVNYDENGGNAVNTKFLFASSDATRTALYDNIFRRGTCNTLFQTQPQTKHVYPGNNTTLSATVIGIGAEGFTYQWKKGGTEIGGATASSFTITGYDDATHGGEYTLAVTDGCGRVTLSDPARLQQCTELAITGQPANVIFTPGESDFRLSVATTGDALSGISYQWQKKTNPASAWHDVPGATDRELTLGGSSSSSQGIYRVIVSQVCDGHPSQVASAESVVETRNAACLERRPYEENVSESACNVADVKTSLAKLVFDYSSGLGSAGDFIHFRLPDGSWYESDRKFTFEQLSELTLVVPRGTQLVFTSDGVDDMNGDGDYGYKIEVQALGGIVPWLKSLFY